MELLLDKFGAYIIILFNSIEIFGNMIFFDNNFKRHKIPKKTFNFELDI